MQPLPPCPVSTEAFGAMFVLDSAIISVHAGKELMKAVDTVQDFLSQMYKISWSRDQLICIITSNDSTLTLKSCDNCTF